MVHTQGGRQGAGGKEGERRGEEEGEADGAASALPEQLDSSFPLLDTTAAPARQL